MDPPGENTRRKSIEDCCTTTALQHNTEPNTWSILVRREEPEDREGEGECEEKVLQVRRSRQEIARQLQLGLHPVF